MSTYRYFIAKDSTGPSDSAPNGRPRKRMFVFYDENSFPRLVGNHNNVGVPENVVEFENMFVNGYDMAVYHAEKSMVRKGWDVSRIDTKELYEKSTPSRPEPEE